MRRFVVGAGLVGATVAFVCTAALFWTQPALAALACPRCFGLERLQDSVFVDPAMNRAERSRVSEVILEGKARTASFFGSLQERPVILVCATSECSSRLGDKGARALSYAQFGLRLTPRGLDSVTVAHELTHIEAHGRIGLIRFLTGALPAWFDEGLAVLVSNDPLYLLPEGSTDRCREESSTELPSSMRDWMRRAGAENVLYAQASCRVLRWSDAHGGRPALLALINRIGAGERFEALWSAAQER